jgi:hypothetical protein
MQSALSGRPRVFHPGFASEEVTPRQHVPIRNEIVHFTCAPNEPCPLPESGFVLGVLEILLKRNCTKRKAVNGGGHPDPNSFCPYCGLV